MITLQHQDYSNLPVDKFRPHYGYSLASSSELPVISIVTRFFNNDEVFHQTAQSILEQSLQQFEWLIVNDGSTDPNALRILEEYRHKDNRIRVIDHPQNLGLSAARNTGVREARTDYILFLDSDDLLEPTAAEKWWWFLLTHPQFSFVASYHVAFGGLNYLWTGGFHDGALNAEQNRVSMMCMVRKSVHEAVGGFDESIRGGLEDWEFWMRCAAQGYWGATIPEFLAWYRVRAEHSDRWENLHEERIKEFRAYLQQCHPRLYQGQFPNPPLQQIDLDLTQVTLECPQVNHLRKTHCRLLLILPWLVMGGAERFALNLMDQLQRRGWQITLVATAPSEHPWLHEFTRRSEDVFLLPNFLPIKDYPRFLEYLITTRQVDAVMIQGSLEGYRLLPVLRSLFPNLTFLDYLHFVTPDWMDGGFPRLSLLYHDCIDMTVTSCYQVRQWMLNQGADPERMRVCFIGVDPQIWRPNPILRQSERSRLGIGKEETVILYAARLETQKQPQLFIKVLHELMLHGVAFYALVAGEGSLKTFLENDIRSYGLQDRVRLLGSIPPDDMPAIMDASDIFFLPSQNEGISQAVYEAMACGLVVVGANVGGQEELVTPECGRLVRFESDEQILKDFTEILEKLIGDPQSRLQMGINARERILSHFTLTQMGEKMEEFLKEMVERKREDKRENKVDNVMYSFKREGQLGVEYLQARDLAHIYQKKYVELYDNYAELNAKYAESIMPRSPSFWFYLWLRQLLLPIYHHLSNPKILTFIGKLKTSVKKHLDLG